MSELDPMGLLVRPIEEMGREQLIDVLREANFRAVAKLKQDADFAWVDYARAVGLPLEREPSMQPTTGQEAMALHFAEQYRLRMARLYAEKDARIVALESAVATALRHLGECQAEYEAYDKQSRVIEAIDALSAVAKKTKSHYSPVSSGV